MTICKAMAFAFLGALLASPVFGAGGGGGGSQATCESDVWVCSDWGVCEPEGVEKRSCTMTFDCAGENLISARPPESRSCTPPLPPPPPPPPEPQASPQPEAGTAPLADPPPPAPVQTPPPPSIQRPAPPAPRPTPPAPTEASVPPPAPSCAVDTWACEEWRACDADGNHIRRCAKAKDCPVVDTPGPRFVKPCETLQCGNLLTIRERVSCRLNLTPAGIAQELKIEYLPEACRVETGDARAACIARYRSYQPCWNVPDDPGRNACAKTVLNLGRTIGRNDRDKVFAMIIFRFYNLEKRAEDLTYQGADFARVAEFVSFIQEKKIAFYGAKNKAERRRIILDVRTEWKRFYNDIKDQLQ